MGSNTNTSTIVEPKDAAESDDKGQRPPKLVEHRKMHDCLCIIIYGVFWLGLLIIAGISYVYGDGLRIVFGQDYLGNTCSPGGAGCGNQTCGTNVFFPRAGVDAILQGFATDQVAIHFLGSSASELTDAISDSAQSNSEVTLFGVCVDECPSAGDFVCTYEAEEELQRRFPSASDDKQQNGARVEFLNKCHLEMQLHSYGILNAFGLRSSALSNDCRHYMEYCWRTSKGYESLFFRCVPHKFHNTTHTTQCLLPLVQPETSLRMPVEICSDQLEVDILEEECDALKCYQRSGGTCIPNPRCSQVLASQTTNYMYSSQDAQSSASDIVESVITSWKSVVSRWIGDLEQSWYTILLVGLGAAMLLGLLWLKVLDKFVAFFVWTMAFVSVLCTSLLTVFALGKAGVIDVDVAATWLATQLELGTELVVGNSTAVNEGNNDIQSTSFSVLGSASTEVERTWWGILSVILGCLVALLLIVLLLFRRRIKVAIAIYKEASMVVRSYPSMFLVPVFNTLAVLVCGCYFIFVFGYLYTAGSLEDEVISMSHVWNTLSDDQGDARRLGIQNPVERLVTLSKEHELVGTLNGTLHSSIVELGILNDTLRKSSVDLGILNDRLRINSITELGILNGTLRNGAVDLGILNDTLRKSAVDLSILNDRLRINSITELGTLNGSSRNNRMLIVENIPLLLNDSLTALETTLHRVAPLHRGRAMMMYHFVGFIWTLNIISGIGYVTISGAVCQAYWTRPDEKKRYFAIWRPLKLAVSTHLGSIIFGALILGIAQVLRWMIHYLDQQTKQLQKQSIIMRAVVKVIKCLFCCFEKLVKLITEAAYVMIAMYGYSFCKSSKEAMGYLTNNAGRIATVQFMGNLVFILSKLVIVAGCVGIEYLWLANDVVFGPGGARELSSTTLPIVLTGLTAYVVATVYMYVYSVSVDSILLCFCVDAAINKQSKAYFMPKSLRRFFSNAKKKQRMRKAAAKKINSGKHQQHSKVTPS